VVVVLLIRLQAYLEAHGAMPPNPWGLPYAVGLLAFFALVWPVLVVAWHRRFARRALERVVREVVAA
jgi:hypothetical protein